MPGTYSQLLFHIVFSTKGRQPWIAPEISDRAHDVEFDERYVLE